MAVDKSQSQRNAAIVQIKARIDRVYIGHSCTPCVLGSNKFAYSSVYAENRVLGQKSIEAINSSHGELS